MLGLDTHAQGNESSKKVKHAGVIIQELSHSKQPKKQLKQALNAKRAQTTT
jgi:hypothetical protein